MTNMEYMSLALERMIAAGRDYLQAYCDNDMSAGNDASDRIDDAISAIRSVAPNEEHKP